MKKLRLFHKEDYLRYLEELIDHEYDRSMPYTHQKDSVYSLMARYQRAVKQHEIETGYRYREIEK